MSVAPGDIIELTLPEGIAYGRIVMRGAAYPPAIAFLPHLEPQPLPEPEKALAGADPVILLVPLDPAEASGALKIVARQLPGPLPRFRVPVRDRTGRVLYEWQWNGEEIAMRGPEDTETLPTREIVAIRDLPALLKRA